MKVCSNNAATCEVGRLERRQFKNAAGVVLHCMQCMNYTCGSSFKPGTFSRSNENCNGTRFLVVESDTLTKDEIGAVFAYLNRRLHYNLHAIIDTAGKSLHGWFDTPPERRTETRLKEMLTVFGCDPKLFTYSQPVRVPGAYRDGRMQRLVWLKD